MEGALCIIIIVLCSGNCHKYLLFIRLVLQRCLFLVFVFVPFLFLFELY